MTVFMTSCIGPRENGPISSIYTYNMFLRNLKERWKHDSRVLILAADPTSPRNDGWVDVMKKCFADGGLSYNCIELCDNRNLNLADRVCQFDVVILAGGHVPTQNAFFSRIRLGERLAGFQGIIIGISAGSMNCASTVYAHVERAGEAIDPNYRRFMPGLGLTDRMILPHYQEIKDDVLDGLRVFEDVAYPDSKGKEFLCLPDGSYLMIENDQEIIWGEAYSLRDGILRQICRNEESLILT